MPFFASSSRSTKAKPVVIASTESFFPFRSAKVFTPLAPSTERKPLSLPMKANRSGLSGISASPCPSW